MLSVSKVEDLYDEKLRRETRSMKQKEEQVWELLENGKVIKTNLSHTRAKNLKWLKQKEANDDWLDLTYEIRRVE